MEKDVSFLESMPVSRAGKKKVSFGSAKKKTNAVLFWEKKKAAVKPSRWGKKHRKRERFQKKKGGVFSAKRQNRNVQLELVAWLEGRKTDRHRKGGPNQKPRKLTEIQT